MHPYGRSEPDPAFLARMMAQLDIPMEEHESMIETIDAVNEEIFFEEIARNPKVRAEWERFLFARHDEKEN